jgi:trehalose 6-phosphate synthase/phosphatase
MNEFKSSCDTSREVYHEISKLPVLKLDSFKDKISKSKKRSFILDYDGTLVDLTDHPRFAFPTDELISVLKKLLKNEKNEIVILTGRTKTPMQIFLKDVESEIGISTEHGMLTKDCRSDKWYSLYDNEVDLKWKNILLPVITHFSNRTPGSFVEDNTNSLVFHYRNAESVFGKFQANELVLHVEHTFGSLPVDIITGKKIIEFRALGVSKGNATEKLISKMKPDFAFVVGDDKTDEEAFVVLNKLQLESKDEDFFGISTVVGNREGKTSQAQYRLHTPSELISILNEISEIE